jgi:putative ABC transport system permease protein
MFSEIRYVIRSLLRRKGFALVTVLTLALGIGSATAIYTVVDWFIFKQVPSPKDVYMVGSASKDGQFNAESIQSLYEACEAGTDAFSEFGGASYEFGNVVVDKDPVASGFQAVTINVFSMLGVSPALGRGFVKGEDVEGRNQVAIVAAGFAKKNLGGLEKALGRKIIVNQEECTVVGVLREGQRMPVYIQNGVYRPLVIHPDPTHPFDHWLVVLGRVKPGVSREQAQAALAGVKVDLPPAMAEFMNFNKPALQTISEMEKINRPELYWMLLGAVGFLFAIACLNATNLMLVHMAGKQLETSIRLALGGGRFGIIRLLLIETLGLCICGSALGALVANGLIPVFKVAAGSLDTTPGWMTWQLSWKTYLVLGGLTLFTGFVIAFFPGLHALRSGIQGGLKNGGGAIGESRGVARVRGMFVVLQTTFAVVLLVGAGLMVRTFQKLEEVKLGFDPSHRVKMQLNFPKGYPSEREERMAILNRLRDVLEKVPGVNSVAYASESLLAAYWSMTMDIESADAKTLTVNTVYASPEYQKTGGITLKRGAWIKPDSKGDVVINESLARVRFGNEDPIGQYIKALGVTTSSPGVFRGWRVVGVVGDVRENLRAEPGNKLYLPADWSPEMITNFIVIVSGEPSGESSTRLRQAVYQFDPRIVTNNSSPILDQLKEQLRHERLGLAVLRVLSVIAILLTIVGLFSVLAYSVDRRMPEFGVRMALGATPSQLVKLVVRRGMALTALGVVLGMAGAMALTRFLQSLLFETQPYDPEVIGAVAALLLVSALAACLLPAIKASKPDVSRLLKGD